MVIIIHTIYNIQYEINGLGYNNKWILYELFIVNKGVHVKYNYMNILLYHK